MEDKNLHDIKIDDLDNQKKTPLKNILTLLALLFIILVISVVITKLILNTDEGQEIDNNLTAATISTETESDLNNSNSLLSTSNTTDSTNSDNEASNVKETLAAAAAGAVVAPIVNTALKERNLSSSKTKVTLREHRPAPVVKETKEVKSTSSYKAPRNPTPKKTYVEKKAVVKSTPAPAPSTSTSNEAVSNIASPSTGYYIKVGTFKDISIATDKIKKTGLDYTLIKTKDDASMTRVLIGPFSEKEAAKSHLKDVQTNITPGAYITRIK